MSRVAHSFLFVAHHPLHTFHLWIVSTHDHCIWHMPSTALLPCRLQSAARDARKEYSELSSKGLAELKTFVKVGLCQAYMVNFWTHAIKVNPLNLWVKCIFTIFDLPGERNMYSREKEHVLFSKARELPASSLASSRNLPWNVGFPRPDQKALGADVLVPKRILGIAHQRLALAI